MAKKEKEITQKMIEQEENYVMYLKKRLESENFKKAVTNEEYQAEKKKYEKSKLKLKFMKESS